MKKRSCVGAYVTRMGLSTVHCSLMDLYGEKECSGFTVNRTSQGEIDYKITMPSTMYLVETRDEIEANRDRYRWQYTHRATSSNMWPTKGMEHDEKGIEVKLFLLWFIGGLKYIVFDAKRVPSIPLSVSSKYIYNFGSLSIPNFFYQGAILS